MHPFTLERPRSLADAIAFRPQAGRTDALVEYIAGGTDMLQLLQEDVRRPEQLVSVDYAPEPGTTDISQAPVGPSRQSVGEGGGQPQETRRGAPEQALDDAAVKVDQTWVIPRENHNPIESHATIAAWEGGRLLLRDKSQWVGNVADEMAAVFGMPAEERFVDMYRSQLRPFEGQYEVAPGGGVCCTGGDRLTFLGDAVFPNHFDHPDWHNAFDHDPEEAVRVRVRLLRELAASGEPVVAAHLPFPSVGRVALAGEVFRFVPADWEY
jgi:hypothetical protein